MKVFGEAGLIYQFRCTIYPSIKPFNPKQMKQDLLRVFLFLLMASPIGMVAQPTLSGAGTNPQPGEMFLIHSADTTGYNPGSAGANQTWDFSNLASSATFTIGFVDPATTPNAGVFSAATVAAAQAPIYDYYIANSSEYTRMGADNGQTQIPYSDGQTQLTFPMTYGTSFVDSFAATYTSGFTFYRSGTIDVEADGYGTLVTPQGTFQNVLRVHYQEAYSDDASVITYNYTSDIYAWYLEGTHYPIYSYTEFYLDGNLAYKYNRFLDQTAISASGGTAFGQEWTIFPNPATDQASIQLEAKKAGMLNIEVLDLRGAVVRRMPATYVHGGLQRIPMDIEGMSAGMYLVRIELNGQSQSQKLRLY